jgi:hypothetical protein
LSRDASDPLKRRIYAPPHEFTEADIARGWAACCHEFKQRPKRFDRWPQAEIDIAVAKLRAEFKQQEWGKRNSVLLQMLEKLVKIHNQRLGEEQKQMK